MPVIMQKNIVNINITLFFGFRMPFSNVYTCSFQVELPEHYGHQPVHSVEQLYLFRKALYFEDHETCQKLNDSREVRVAKHLGSHILGRNPNETS